jgi:hypothetical protein
MDVEMELEIVERAILKPFEDNVAGIVDENVEPAIPLAYRFDYQLPLRFVGYVECHRLAAYIGRYGLCLFDRAIGHDDPRALFGKSLAIGLAKTHGAARDERDAAFHPSSHVFLPTCRFLAKVLRAFVRTTVQSDERTRRFPGVLAGALMKNHSMPAAAAR